MTTTSTRALRAPYDINPVTGIKLPGELNAAHYDGSKETIGSMTYAVIVDGNIKTPISVKWYMGRSKSASVVYCTARISGKVGDTVIHASGSGRAGGHGYHKESSAANCALDSAGVDFTASFGGCGDRAVEVAIRAVADYLGWPTDGRFI